MKKIVISSFVLAYLAVASMAIAGMEVLSKDSFSCTGDAASTTIKAGTGQIVDQSLCLDVDTNATVTVRRASKKTKLQAVVAASTNVYVYTTASNKVDGFTLTTSDYLLIADSGSTGYQLRQITSIQVYTNYYTHYGLNAVVTAADDSPVYIIDTTDNVTIPAGASSDQTGLQNMFVGFLGMPIHISLSTGSGPNSVISGVVSYEK